MEEVVEDEGKKGQKSDGSDLIDQMESPEKDDDREDDGNKEMQLSDDDGSLFQQSDKLEGSDDQMCTPLVPSEKRNKGTSSTTLIILPLTLLEQWKEEISTKTMLTYMVHYGDATKKGSRANFESVNVVLTTCKWCSISIQSHLTKDTNHKWCPVLYYHFNGNK